jgi:hypothetical protein
MSRLWAPSAVLIGTAGTKFFEWPASHQRSSSLSARQYELQGHRSERSILAGPPCSGWPEWD